jgi:hypothetical protein
VIGFVITGIAISLAGPGAGLADNKAVSKDKQMQDKDYVKAERKRVNFNKQSEF